MHDWHAESFPYTEPRYSLSLSLSLSVSLSFSLGCSKSDGRDGPGLEPGSLDSKPYDHDDDGNDSQSNANLVHHKTGMLKLPMCNDADDDDDTRVGAGRVVWVAPFANEASGPQPLIPAARFKIRGSGC